MLILISLVVTTDVGQHDTKQVGVDALQLLASAAGHVAPGAARAHHQQHAFQSGRQNGGVRERAGVGPLASSRTPAAGVSRNGSCALSPSRMLARPSSRSRPNRVCWPGRRRSASRTMTRRPVWARAMARFATVVDFPSPAAALVTPMVCSWRSAYANWRLAARLRYASAAGECGSASITSAPLGGTAAIDWPFRETVASQLIRV